MSDEAARLVRHEAQSSRRTVPQDFQFKLAANTIIKNMNPPRKGVNEKDQEEEEIKRIILNMIKKGN